MDDDDDDATRTHKALVGDIVRRSLVIGLSFVATAAVTRVVSKRLAGLDSRHSGPSLRPFTQRYDGHTLSSSQLAQVEAGNKVLISAREMNAGGGRGSAVCDIAAPPNLVWKTILAFERYPGRLAQCKAAHVYDRRKMSFTAESIKVHMILDGIIKDFNCYYDHTWRPDQNVLTWTLDPMRKSDFVDVQGQWCVDKHPTKSDWSRVWYSADVKLPPWLPRLVIVHLCKTSGNKALTFCKRDAEAQYANRRDTRGLRNWIKLRGGGLTLPAATLCSKTLLLTNTNTLPRALLSWRPHL